MPIKPKEPRIRKAPDSFGGARDTIYEQDVAFFKYIDALKWSRFQTAAATSAGELERVVVRRRIEQIADRVRLIADRGHGTSLPAVALDDALASLARNELHQVSPGKVVAGDRGIAGHSNPMVVHRLTD